MEGSCESSRRDDFKSSGSSQAIDLGDKRYTGANYIGEGHGNYPETHSQPAWPKSASPPSAWQGSRSNVNKSRPLVFRPGTRLGGLIFPGLQQPQKPENWYRCDQCPQAFSRTDHLEGHKQQHLAAQQYACGGCKRAFFAQDALNVRTSCQPPSEEYSHAYCSHIVTQRGRMSRRWKGKGGRGWRPSSTGSLPATQSTRSSR